MFSFAIIKGRIAVLYICIVGVSLYGIGGLELLRVGVHKFESHYTDWLVAPYPEGRDQWVQRSPLFAVDKIVAPLLLLHGDEDEVLFTLFKIF